MKRYIFLFFLSVCSLGHAQLLDKYFHLTSDSILAKYYRTYINSDSGIIEKTYHINDSIFSFYTLSSKEPRILNGIHYKYFDNGKIKEECYYSNDNINGKYYQYYESGKLECEKDYIDGELDGYLKSYYETGIPRRLDKYLNGKLIEGKCYSSHGQDTTYFVYEQMATFKKGGLDKFSKYVASKIEYPLIASERGITGKVIIGFCINKVGKVVDVEVIESPNFYLSKAAVDVILNSPDWEPGLQEGKRVKQNFIIPVNFSFK
jgi:TonB family protein